PLRLPSRRRSASAAAFNSPASASAKAAAQPRNCCAVRLVYRVMRKPASGDMLGQRALDFFGVQALAAVQTVEQAVDDLLRLVFTEVLDEPVVKMLAVHGVVDLSFLVVILELG